MKGIPRILATILILALANLSSINLALANPTREPKVPPTKPNPNVAHKSYSGPDDDPCLPHATKACIQQDLDDVATELHDLLGDDPNGFGNKLLRDAGLDPFEDIEDSKTDIDNLPDEDFTKHAGHFDKLHKKAQKRKNNMNALLSNKNLLALIQRPSPLNFRVVAGSANVLGTKERVVFSTAKDSARAFPSMKKGSSEGTYSKGLANLSIVVMPELTHTCSPGNGLPGGVNDLILGKAITLAAEVIKEAIPSDTPAVAPHGVAVAVWAGAKAAEFILDGLHAVYMECNAAQREHQVDLDIGSIKTTVGGINTTVGGINTHTTSIKNDIVNNNNDNKDDIVQNDDTNKDAILTKIDSSGDKTTDVVNQTSTTINNNISSVNTTINNTKNELNTNITNTKNELNTTINDNRTLIINNANSNTLQLTNFSLRLMIEADLATPDSSTPLGIFETPASKGGYIEIARMIVFETIRNLTGATVAQANAILASADSLLAAGKYKAAYAALRKAYKSAAN